jgi:Glycosyltransferase family 25 (LPS biosynthesis protein)
MQESPIFNELPETKIYNSEYLGISKISNLVIGVDIPPIIVINLRSREDRKQQIINELYKHNLPFSFYSSDLHPEPTRGCLESHINIVKWVKAHNYKCVCIFEDDVIIKENLDTLMTLPAKFDMIYLGGLCTEVYEWGEPFIENRWVKGQIYCNHAYIVNSSVYDVIINEGWIYQNELDRFYTGTIHSFPDKYNVYLSYIQYVVQSEGWSDIDRKNKWGNDWLGQSSSENWPKAGQSFKIP